MRQVQYDDILLDDLEPFIPTEDQPTMATATVPLTDPATVAPTKPSRPRQVKLGDQVKYGGLDAIVLEVDRPSDPDSSVVLAYMDPDTKRRRIVEAEHEISPVGWSFDDEREAARVRTPLEAWAQARSHGERVAEVGLTVRYAYNRAKCSGYEIQPVLGRVAEVHGRVDGCDIVDLQLMKNRPDDAAPDAIDEVFKTVRNIRHSKLSCPSDVKCGRPNTWTFTDETLIQPFGPIGHARLFAPPCPSCKEPMLQAIEVPIGPERPGGPDEMMSVCPECIARLRALLINPSSSALVPA